MAKDTSAVSYEKSVKGDIQTYVPVAKTERTDTKVVVIAVGASIVLFVIGLILGYLLGHEASSSGFDRSDTMMNNGSNYFRNQQRTSGNDTGQSAAN